MSRQTSAASAGCGPQSRPKSVLRRFCTGHTSHAPLRLPSARREPETWRTDLTGSGSSSRCSTSPSGRSQRSPSVSGRHSTPAAPSSPASIASSASSRSGTACATMRAPALSSCSARQRVAIQDCRRRRGFAGSRALTRQSPARPGSSVSHGVTAIEQPMPPGGGRSQRTTDTPSVLVHHSSLRCAVSRAMDQLPTGVYGRRVGLAMMATWRAVSRSRPTFSMSAQLRTPILPSLVSKTPGPL
mmetsp:Transcript_84913/g.253110  ORF Transcript_84913/g.253110 Transcript_84913/m.253110 type:complete len:243 (+) Transcript_84913:1244-1972(+)